MTRCGNSLRSIHYRCPLDQSVVMECVNQVKMHRIVQMIVGRFVEMALVTLVRLMFPVQLIVQHLIVFMRLTRNHVMVALIQENCMIIF